MKKILNYIKMHRRLLILILVVALLDTGLVYARVYRAKHGLFTGELLGPYTVTKVSDGDTFWIKDAVEYPDSVKVRLIGVDCPESVAPESYLEQTGKNNSTDGQRISDYVKRLILQKAVYLEFDVRTEDKYGRLLAYVYLDGTGKEMLQETLLANGFAQLDTVQPNVKYEERFYRIQMDARKEKRGLWAQNGF